MDQSDFEKNTDYIKSKVFIADQGMDERRDFVDKKAQFILMRIAWHRGWDPLSQTKYLLLVLFI